MTLRPHTLFGKLFLGTFLLIVAVLCTCVWLIAKEVDRFQAAELTEHLRTQASVIQQAVGDRFDHEHAAELERIAQGVGSPEGGGIRITMILRDGTVLADSEADTRDMKSHAERGEVRQALADGWGEDTRYSETVLRMMKYVAVRVGPAESPLGVVRVSMGLRTIGQRSQAVRGLIRTVGLLGVAAAVLFALGLARLWSRPIRRITVIARSLSRGDLSARARVTGDDEIAMLARSLNEMRDHLTEQLQTIERQGRTLESLLRQLQEGVIVAGADGRIVLINPAAVRLLGLSSEGARQADALVGLAIEECISHHELQKLLTPAPGGSETPAGETAAPGAEPAIREIRIQTDADNGEWFLLARASDIVLPGGETQEGTSQRDRRGSMGRILLLTDVTALNRTARMKMDFASNASHELRTPLSAIRAAIETLMNTDLARDAEATQHCLDVIDRHSRRMEQMVVDLLSLSRIELSPGRFKAQPLDLRGFLGDLHGRYLDRLEARQLQWLVDAPPDLGMIEANPYLLGLVLDNLVDNAIKFTDAGGRISVSCRRLPGEGMGGGAVSMTVADTGCGIPEDEQGRVFERFYQVEKERSGADRGTGLGLSIVRHAVTAMNGTVDLTSRVGEGTRVTITIPPSG